MHPAKSSWTGLSLVWFAGVTPECILKVVTGEHWTGSPNKSIDQIGKHCPKNVWKTSKNCVFSPSGRFADIFRHFSDILSTFPFSGLSNHLPVAIWKSFYWDLFLGPKAPRGAAVKKLNLVHLENVDDFSWNLLRPFSLEIEGRTSAKNFAKISPHFSPISCAKISQELCSGGFYWGHNLFFSMVGSSGNATPPGQSVAADNLRLCQLARQLRELDSQRQQCLKTGDSEAQETIPCVTKWLPIYPLTRNYYENNSLRIIFRNFRWNLHSQISRKERLFSRNYAWIS